MDIPVTHKFIFEGSITADQKLFYNEYGFIHFKHFLNPLELGAVENFLDSVYDTVTRNRLMSVNGIPIRYGKDEHGETIIQRLPYTSSFSKKLEMLLLNKGITGLTSLIKRQDVRLGFNEMDGLVTNYFINTPGSNYKQMGWHTDGLRDMLLMRPPLPMINVGIYLDDSGPVNGGLRVIPHTHMEGFKSMLFRKLHLLDKKADKGEFLIIAEKGDMVLHDGRLWHRVARAPKTGLKSRRRVIYLPLICGKTAPRDDNSKMPFYHMINRYARYQ